MRSRRMLWLVCGLAWSVSSACESDAADARGARGESCAARADCEPGLVCLDNRCWSAGANLTGDNDAGAESSPDTRGAAGESCGRRADCVSGLFCFANVCVESPMTTVPLHSSLGERGESCQARNDCQAGLACVLNRCVVGDSELAVHAKQCFRVQCELSEDCCEKFVAPLQCPTWKMACSGGDMAACTSFNASCSCNLQCQNSSCVAARKCMADGDCALATERCFAGTCAQCASDTDCVMPGQKCLSGVCRAGCERDEQCPLFFACQSHECREVGCKSDRECYFATKSPLARCQTGDCVVPCSSDAQCPELQLCHESRCTFAGCESNDECRVLLNLSNQPGSDRAVCRLPDR